MSGSAAWMARPLTACPAILEILLAQHVEVPELQCSVADLGEERGELARFRTARVLHSLFEGRELHHEHVPVVGVSVSLENRSMRDAMTCGLGHPRVEVGVEVVDSSRREL